MHKQIKQNPKTNQTKPKNKSNQTQTNQIKPTAKRAHATQPRERSQEEKRVWEIGVKRFWPMMADREVWDGGGVNRFSERRWQSVLGAAVGSMRCSGGGVVLRVRVCLRVQRREWSIWASVESEGFFVVESELQSCLMFAFFFVFFYYFIYTKWPFGKRWNWRFVKLRFVKLGPTRTLNWR